MNRLYAINDVMSTLADEYGVRDQFAAGADADYEAWLDDLTQVVAKAMGVEA